MTQEEKVRGLASYFPSITCKYGKSIAHWFTQFDTMADRAHMTHVALLGIEHGIGHGHANALVAFHRSNTERAPRLRHPQRAPRVPVLRMTTKADMSDSDTTRLYPWLPADMGAGVALGATFDKTAPAIAIGLALGVVPGSSRRVACADGGTDGVDR